MGRLDHSRLFTSYTKLAGERKRKKSRHQLSFPTNLRLRLLFLFFYCNYLSAHSFHLLSPLLFPLVSPFLFQKRNPYAVPLQRAMNRSIRTADREIARANDRMIPSIEARLQRRDQIESHWLKHSTKINRARGNYSFLKLAFFTPPLLCLLYSSLSTQILRFSSQSPTAAAVPFSCFFLARFDVVL